MLRISSLPAKKSGSTGCKKIKSLVPSVPKYFRLLLLFFFDAIMDNLLIRYHTCGVCVHDIEYACKDFKTGKKLSDLFFSEFLFRGSLSVILKIYYMAAVIT